MSSQFHPDVAATRAKIARLAGMLYERRLLDAAGGNLSARVGDVICMTSRYSGSKFQWNIRPDQVLVVDNTGNILEGEGSISREAKVHLKLLNEFPEGGSVIHAHSPNALVFAALNQPIPAVLEQTQKFGPIQCVPFAPAHSQDLAENVAAAIRGQEERIKKQAAAVIMPWHGLFLIAKDLDAAYDAVERIDGQARIVIMANLMKLAGMNTLSEEQAVYQAAVDAYEAVKH